MKSIHLMKNVGRFTPPEIAKSDLPSNRQVRFTLKSPVRLTPPEIAKSYWSFAEKTFVKQSMMLCAFEILLKIG